MPQFARRNQLIDRLSTEQQRQLGLEPRTVPFGEIVWSLRQFGVSRVEFREIGAGEWTVQAAVGARFTPQEQDLLRAALDDGCSTLQGGTLRLEYVS